MQSHSICSLVPNAVSNRMQVTLYSSGVSRATRRLMRKNAYREIVQPVLQKPFGEADLGCTSIP